MTQVEPRCDAVVLLAASRGLGGGIETMLDATVEAVAEAGFSPLVVALSDEDHPIATLSRKLHLLGKAAIASRRNRSQGLQIVVAHPSLIVVGLLATALGRSRRVPVILFYLVDIWDVPRWQIRLVRRGAFRSFTISDYSAGALARAGAGPAWVLPATLDTNRMAALAAYRRPRHREDLAKPEILSVLRLEDAKDKGALVLIDAVERCREKLPGATVTIAGSGPVPADLAVAASNHHWVTVMADLSVEELAELYGRATLFALCTRTRPWARPIPYGEGLGLVLAEAQLVGLPVVAPAAGGSSNAYLEGVTGTRPIDETAGALADALTGILSQPERYEAMSAQALAWAPEAFDRGHLSRYWKAILGESAFRG